MRLQGLKRLSMHYAPLLPGAASVAQLFNECTTAKALQSNPSCSVKLEFLDRGEPLLDIEFSNGAKLSVPTRDKTVKALKSIIEEKQQDMKTLQMLREEGYGFDQLKPEEIPDLERARLMARPFARKLYKGLKPVP